MRTNYGLLRNADTMEKHDMQRKNFLQTVDNYNGVDVVTGKLVIVCMGVLVCMCGVGLLLYEMNLRCIFLPLLCIDL